MRRLLAGYLCFLNLLAATGATGIMGFVALEVIRSSHWPMALVIAVLWLIIMPVAGYAVIVLGREFGRSQ